MSLSAASLPSPPRNPRPQPTSFLRLHTDDHSDPNCKIKINHGTTTLAFRYKGGIVVAVDSRATAGSYVGAFGSLWRRRTGLAVAGGSSLAGP